MYLGKLDDPFLHVVAIGQKGIRHPPMPVDMRGEELAISARWVRIGDRSCCQGKCNQVEIGQKKEYVAARLERTHMG